MDMLKAKQIRSIMQEVENSVISSGSTSSEEDDRERSRTAVRRRSSAASQERWAESISSSSLGPSIWGTQVSAQERGRASRSASFSVGQEVSNAPNAKHITREKQPADSAYDQTRLLREQFQQMKFKNRSKSSYAAAWHVPDFEDDNGSEDAILDEEDLVARLRRGDPPGLRYTTPSNPRLDSLRDKERRSSFNASPLLSSTFDHPARSPLASESLRRDSYSMPQRLAPETMRREPHLGLGPSHAQFQQQQPSARPQTFDGGSKESFGGNFMADVDRYFSSDDHRTRTRTHLAQTAAAQTALMTQTPSPMPNGPLYIVEFKACRTDVFYIAEGSGLEVHVGDLVLVEADRGRDLGKVIRENVSMSQVRALKAQQAREQALAMGGMQDDSEKINVNNIQAKLIYRLSQPSEIAMLLVKSQDEQQAMLVCQAKVRQRKLPMEVLDGEYQWDRRKLTFYYYASQRIDFRELVRDLFKIYKTRIWMCASNPTSISNANTSLGAPGAIGESKNHTTLPIGGQPYMYGAPSMLGGPPMPGMSPISGQQMPQPGYGYSPQQHGQHHQHQQQQQQQQQQNQPYEYSPYMQQIMY